MQRALKEKTSINDYVWVGRNLIPRLLFCGLFFMGAFASEAAILVFEFFVSILFPDVCFVYLTVMTAIAMAIFLFERTSLDRKLKQRVTETFPN